MSIPVVQFFLLILFIILNLYMYVVLMEKLWFGQFHLNSSKPLRVSIPELTDQGVKIPES